MNSTYDYNLSNFQHPTTHQFLIFSNRNTQITNNKRTFDLNDLNIKFMRNLLNLKKQSPRNIQMKT